MDIRREEGLQAASIPRQAASSGKRSRPFSYFRSGQRSDVSGHNKPILELEGVCKWFREDVPTLQNIHLQVERGEFLYITGPSGAGKSTLLQLLYREHQIDEGRIFFCGHDVSRLGRESVPFLRRNIGVVFQDFKNVGHWNIFDNVALPLEILDLPSRVVRSRVSEALDRVGLGGRGRERVSRLSGGEQQRVSVARAIVGEPALVLADEPTGNLDPALALDILTLFEEIHAAGTTVIFATHDHSLLAARPHRLLVLDGGCLNEADERLPAWNMQPAANG